MKVIDEGEMEKNVPMENEDYSNHREFLCSQFGSLFSVSDTPTRPLQINVMPNLDTSEISQTMSYAITH